ncbi:gas vesicle protein GvpJ [Halomarina ordinaria]|uniref:Gas vesicle protein GvpJ n=1 Tax=Halomarina ordinaria TaxID=3033939 RepID=A0ABD5UB65_9EURY|nr:gas vesicle protein [Halomarina sp. PSRA2]
MAEPERYDADGSVRPRSDSLADVVEMLLDKGVVINADIVVSIGETELLGIRLRAALASFETAAEYGLEFPEGTDLRRVEHASGRESLEDIESEKPIDMSAPVEELGETAAGGATGGEGDASDEGDASGETDDGDETDTDGSDATDAETGGETNGDGDTEGGDDEN